MVDNKSVVFLYYVLVVAKGVGNCKVRLKYFILGDFDELVFIFYCMCYKYFFFLKDKMDKKGRIDFKILGEEF